MQLRDFVVGSKVNGLEVGKTVEIVAVKHHGDMVADVTYKDANGNLNGQMVYADQATEMKLSEKALPWSFDADADRMRLVSEAYRIHLDSLPDLPIRPDPQFNLLSSVELLCWKGLPLRAGMTSHRLARPFLQVLPCPADAS